MHIAHFASAKYLLRLGCFAFHACLKINVYKNDNDDVMLMMITLIMRLMMTLMLIFILNTQYSCSLYYVHLYTQYTGHDFYTIETTCNCLSIFACEYIRKVDSEFSFLDEKKKRN